MVEDNNAVMSVEDVEDGSDEGKNGVKKEEPPPEPEVVVPRKSDELCGQVPFDWLIDTLEQFNPTFQGKGQANVPSKNKMKLIFSKKFLSWFAGRPGESIYPLVRLLLPNLDKERRGQFGMKEKALARAYLIALNIDPDKPEGQALLHFSDPLKVAAHFKKNECHSGDFGTILAHVLKNRAKAEPPRPVDESETILADKKKITLAEVNELLNCLADGKGKKDVKIDRKWIGMFTAKEHKWLARMIAGDLKIGVSEKNVLGHLSGSMGNKALLERYKNCIDLRATVDEYDASTGTVIALSALQLKPLTTCAPMLADKVKKSGHGMIAGVEKAFKDKPFVMDVKLDGERLMVHVKDGVAKCFSRNAKDYSDLYRSIGDVVKANINVPTCILDGEVLAWNDEASASGYRSGFMPFGTVKSVANAEGQQMDEGHDGDASDNDDDVGETKIVPGAHLIFVVFDIIYLDGPGAFDVVKAALDKHPIGNFTEEKVGSICHVPLLLRRDILSKVCNWVDTRFIMVQHSDPVGIDIHDEERRKALEKFYNMAMDGQFEGIMVKDLTAAYDIGGRSPSWIKVKPDYGGHTRDLDMIVVGAHFAHSGSNYRSQGISRFTCAVVDQDPKTGATTYHTACRVATGYSFEELKNLRERVEPHLGGKGIKWNEAKLPLELKGWNPAEVDKPVYYIPPEHSFVLQVRAGEIIPCTDKIMSAKLVLRFPRIEKIRWDKDPLDIEGLVSLTDLREMQSSGGFRTKLHGGHAAGEARREKTAQASSSRGKGTVDDSFRDKSTTASSTSGCFAATDGKPFPDVFYVAHNSVDKYEVVDGGNPTLTKKYNRVGLQEAIKGQGGMITQNAVIIKDKESHMMAKSRVIVGANTNFTATSLRDLSQGGVYDVLDASYIERCLHAGRHDPTTYDYLYMSHETRNGFGRELDPLCVSYTEGTDERSLRKLFRAFDARVARLKEEDAAIKAAAVKAAAPPKQPPKKKAKLEPAAAAAAAKAPPSPPPPPPPPPPVPPSRREVQAKKRVLKMVGSVSTMTWQDIAATMPYEERLLLDAPETRLWRPSVVVYLDVHDDCAAGTGAVVSHRLLTLSLRMRLHGAVVSAALVPGVSHVVVDPPRLTRTREQMLRARIATFVHTVPPAGDARGRKKQMRIPTPFVVGPEWAERSLLHAVAEVVDEDGEDWADPADEEKVQLAQHM